MTHREKLAPAIGPSSGRVTACRAEAAVPLGMAGRSLAARWALAMWGSPVLAGCAAAVVYLAIAVATWPGGLDQSRHPYFVYLADAFLRGQLALAQTPVDALDLILYQGRYYVWSPPFPALPFVPLVAVFGVGVSDAPLHMAVAGLNVALVGALLKEMDRRGMAKLSVERRAWLTAFFAFGTVHVTVAPYARVWFTAQVVGFALLCAAYLAAMRLPGRWAPLVSGALVGCAFLSRGPMLSGTLWIGWYLWRERDRSDRWSGVRIAVAGLAPVGVAVALLGAYNLLRFGNPLEMGLAYHQMHEQWQEGYGRYGVFSLGYLPANLFYNFFTLPYLAFLGDRPGVDFWMGGSLFLMSPVFILAFPGLVRSWRADGWALAASCLLGLVPILLLMGTGWVQFGPRYTLDVTVPLLMATAIGAAAVSTRLVARLSAISFGVYLPGAVLLGLLLR